MKLTINKQLIQMPIDAKISIERTSPVLNEKTGTFSYPFPVPTLPNEKALGYPGRLQRVGYLSSKEFVLEDGGLQILRGEIDFDDGATRPETGLILKSSLTDFNSIAKNKKLSDLDYGSLYLWPEGPITDDVEARINAWNIYNTNGGDIDSPMAPCVIESGGSVIEVNRVNAATGNFDPNIDWSTFVLNVRLYYMFQFRIRWILPQILEAFGYEVLEDEFAAVSNVFKDAVIFSNPLLINGTWARDGGGTYVTKKVTPYGSINYGDLMPDVLITDFLQAIANMFCIYFDFNERKKTVSIRWKETIFTAAPETAVKLVELDSWKHNVNPETTGYALRYEAQDNEDDTEEDFLVTEEITGSTIPEPEYEGQLIHYQLYDRYYLAKLNESDALYWSRFGRLKGITSGEGELYEQPIKAKIPEQVKMMGAEGPQLKISLDDYQKEGGVAARLSDLYISVYRGKSQLTGLNFPLLCAEETTLADPDLSYSPVQYLTSNLQPKCLINSHQDFLNFKGNTIGATKYLRLSLRDVINLKWNKRYVINGIPILINKINYELPHKGICKIEAYTAPAREEEIDFGPLPPNLIM